jgi:hypothetical protein
VIGVSKIIQKCGPTKGSRLFKLQQIPIVFTASYFLLSTPSAYPVAIRCTYWLQKVLKLRKLHLLQKIAPDVCSCVDYGVGHSPHPQNCSDRRLFATYGSVFNGQI